MSLSALLDTWARRQPDTVLFEFRDVSGHPLARHTYASFRDRTAVLAERLISDGHLKKGERALLAYPPGLGSITALMACARIGVVGVPVLVPTAKRGAAWHRLRAILNDCSPAAILSDRATLSKLGQLLKEEGKLLTKCRLIDTDNRRGAPAPRGLSDEGEVLLLQYTSGSTGSARGVIVTHDNVVANATATLDEPPIGVAWIPQHHDMGLIGYYLFPIVAGGSNYGFSTADFLRRPALWLRMMSDVRATHSSAPNFGFDYCLQDDRIRADDLAGIDLSSVRVLMNASEPARAQTIASFHQRFARYGLRKAACTVAYGLAENTLTVTHGGRGWLRVRRGSLSDRHVELADARERDDVVSIVSCGLAPRGVTVGIRDVRTGGPLGPLQVGEIHVSGRSLTPGYWSDRKPRPGITASRAQEGDFATGDLGFFKDGSLYVCGRIKDVMIVNGVNYYPQDIEAAVDDSEATLRRGRSCAFQVDTGEVVVIVEAPRGRQPPDAAGIAWTVRQECGFTPDVVLFVAPRSLAKTTSGKQARARTRDLYLSGTLTELSRYPPANACNAVQLVPDWRAEVRRIFARYGLSDESIRIMDADLDSLSFTELRFELEHALATAGLAHLGEAVDSTLLQRLSLSDLLGALDHGRHRSGEASPDSRAALARLARSSEDEIQEQLRSDAKKPLTVGPARVRGEESRKGILLTGATGFFGPFLLAELLEHSRHPIFVLVRAASPDLALARIEGALVRARLKTALSRDLLRERVTPICGDLTLPRWGLADAEWNRLAREVREILHNGAFVNYVAAYEALRAANFEGTRTALRLALDSGGARFHHISSTFVFGWTRKATLLETDYNEDMDGLDFGYSQSKWAAERQVVAARGHGLDARIYRPSLLSVSTTGAGDPNDVAVRLIAFMMRHRIAVDTTNQLSILPADIAAHNIVGISQLHDNVGAVLHVTADNYYSLPDLVSAISDCTGIQFTYLNIPQFIEELNRCCSTDDSVYPLLEFFNRSADKIAAMQLKRYMNDHYRRVRSRIAAPRTDPPLTETADLLVRYIKEQGFCD